jgi:hypothetical protein
MPPLPSLACLSLNTEPTSTVLAYDDPTMDNTTMPDTAEFNILIIQRSAPLEIFGIDESLLEVDPRLKHFHARRKLLFNNMMDAILSKVVLIPNDSPGFFYLGQPPGSCISWNNSFSEGSPALTYISRGASNNAFKVEVKDVVFENDDKRRMLDALTGGAAQVLLRKSKDGAGASKMKRILTELAIQSHMSNLEIGPKFYAAWCMPKYPPPRPYLQDIVNMPANTVVENICSISELFDGDLHNVFTDMKDSSLNKDVTDRTENRVYGFWDAVAQCIVLACSHGVCHFDLKGSNMLFKKVKTSPTMYRYIVKYTDFDPGFVKIMNMQNPLMKKMELCFGFLSLYQLLASNRCALGKRKWSNSAGAQTWIDWNLVFDMAKEAFEDAYTQKYGTPTVGEIADLCQFGAAFQPQNSLHRAILKESLTQLLDHWANSYLDDKCLRFEDGLNFHEIANVIMNYAESGSSMGHKYSYQDSSSAGFPSPES